MTTLIRLTKPDIKNDYSGIIFINAAHIVKIFESPDFPGNTMLVFTNRGNCIVKETPEEIAKMIFNAEHPQCKL